MPDDREFQEAKGTFLRLAREAQQSDFKDGDLAERLEDALRHLVRLIRERRES